MRSENLISLTSYLGKLIEICNNGISKYVENIMEKIKTAAARENHASKSVEGVELLKRNQHFTTKGKRQQRNPLRFF